MKIFLISFVFVILLSCSFDKKSGIWKNDSNVGIENNDVYSQFEDLIIVNSPFKNEIKIKDGFKFNIPDSYSNLEWTDIFYNQYNNSKNFKFSELNQKTFRSGKTTRHKIENYILYENDNVILTDQSGDINVYSLSNKKKILKFNFYKKKYKKNLKILNIIVEKNIIYVSDNLGYLYSLDYYNKKILWAKNFKIPFRSNLKIFKDKLILSNQNNHLYFINKNNGNILKLIPTEETVVKNKFINNISLDNESTFFLNTFGSLYSLDNNKMQINWFINLNQNSNINPSDLFLGNKIVNTKDKIIVSTNYFTYIIDNNTGSILFKKKFSSLIKPLIINNYLFLISKNNFLISLNLNTGKIIYSYDINKKISEFLDTKKKRAEFKSILMLNGKIFIFLKNSYVIVFELNGNIEKIVKLPFKMNSAPILVQDSLIFLDFNNKISVVN